MTRIAVIGAGITGVTSAYTLARAGYDVTVVDRCRYPAMDTSFANGGQLSASNAEVWNNGATLLKALRWMWTAGAPLLLNPVPGWHKYTWLAAFVANMPRYRVNTVETVRMAIAARQYLHAMAEEEGIDFDLERRGILHIYPDRRAFEAAKRVNALLREGGLERHAVTPAEVRSIEPSLRTACHGGFYTPSDSTGDIHKFTRGLADACRRRGVKFVMEQEIARIARDGERFLLMPRTADGSVASDGAFDGLVVAAGVASRRIAAMLGDHVNVYPVKGYSITVHLDDDASRQSAPWVSLLDEERKIVTSRLGADRFRVAGTAEINGENRNIRADRIAPLVDWVRQHFPDVGTSRVVPWCGLRPMMPDMMPRVGPGRMPGVFYNTGHGHLGWTLSAATAQILAAAVAAGLPA
ncbi:ketopantoate reductase PanE/ApbA family protein [Paraburkholderia xenovorans LB400]|uniref:D-amino-acid dehydrogenase n=1 Tax=Paraburkholderia xenovorans (strain LB400) TaxID=266265 RepID=Q13HY0_PARXL|nr:D-amino acid dehydrogenase [Paraburkholderia xenovorans]ABE36309.1 D-amino-acid dehydrogenase [Paraburkholderia xenovorans LB400]AIP34037.1 ketopantoate reductase PanE/ApbA family protein [Paraburkholderia xenovorans LB400]